MVRVGVGGAEEGAEEEEGPGGGVGTDEGVVGEEGRGRGAEEDGVGVGERGSGEEEGEEFGRREGVEEEPGSE